MLIFDEKTQAVILDNVSTPLTTEYMWVLDLEIMDFTIVPIVVLEEIVCNSIEIEIQGFAFTLPAEWNILTFDPENSVLDVIQIDELAGKEFEALVYGPEMSRPHSGIIKMTNYKAWHCNVGPLLNKHQMLCHPIAPGKWVNIAPSDVYNKYLKDAVIGDII